MSNSKQKTKWEWKQKHHDQVWAAMRKVLDAEHFSKTLSDTKLTEAIMATGVYATAPITRDVRIAHGIGNCDERRVLLFAKQHKQGHTYGE